MARVVRLTRGAVAKRGTGARGKVAADIAACAYVIRPRLVRRR